MSGAGQWVVIVVLALGIDLGLVPMEDPEGVVGSKVDEGKGNGAGPGFPCG